MIGQTRCVLAFNNKPKQIQWLPTLIRLGVTVQIYHFHLCDILYWTYLDDLTHLTCFSFHKDLEKKLINSRK